MPRNDAAAPGQVCPGIRIQAIDIVQPPGIDISPITDMDAPQAIVAAVLAEKSSIEMPKRTCWKARSETLPRAVCGTCVTALTVALAKGGLSGVRHLHPLRIGCGVRDIALVPVPPLVRAALGVAHRRILPRLLTPERRHVEVAPGGAHGLVATTIDEIGAEHAFAIADERVVAVPFAHPEVGVEAVDDGVPGDFPT